MKRCPKCSRTYPDDNQKFCTGDGGLLLPAEQAFDPNATVQISPPPLGSTPPRDTSRGSQDLPTVALPSSAPTASIPKQTGSTAPPGGVQTPITQVTTALPPRPQSAPSSGAVTPPQPKKSKLPLILGILLLLLVLAVCAIVAIFFLVIKPRLNQLQTDRPVVVQRSENVNVNQNQSVNSNTSEPVSETEYVAPPNTLKFTNSQANLDGKLAEHYLDFSFYYPNTWHVDPKATNYFVKVEKTREDAKGVYLLESASLSWYNSNGGFEADKDVFQDRVKTIEGQLTSTTGYPGYEKISEGETKINSLKAYEFRFKGIYTNTDQGDLPYWGRVILVPGGEGEKTGAVIFLLATSQASDISSPEDLGVKGDMPVILDSFRFGRNK